MVAMLLIARMRPVLAVGLAGALVAALVVALAGCTPRPGSGTAATTATSFAPRVISGSGASHDTVRVPAGAKSARIRATCDGGDAVILSITIGDDGQPHAGACSHSLSFRIPAHGTLELATDVSGPSSYEVTVRFSSTRFTADSRMTTQCAAISAGLSDIVSAQNGYPSGSLNLAGWQALMASGTTKLAAVDTSGTVGAQLQPLIEGYSRSGLAPGESPGEAANAAFTTVNELCLDNGSPLTIVSRYGG